MLVTVSSGETLADGIACVRPGGTVNAFAGVPEGTPVQGLRPGCELQQRILCNDTKLDFAEAQRDVEEAARRLVAEHTHVQTLVLECTNMPPYREAVAAATARSVHDAETLLLRAWREGLTWSPQATH